MDADTIRKIASQNGFSESFNGSQVSIDALSPESKCHLANAVARHIVSNPEGHSEHAVSRATYVVDKGGNLPPETFEFFSS